MLNSSHNETASMLRTSINEGMSEWQIQQMYSPRLYLSSWINFKKYNKVDLGLKIYERGHYHLLRRKANESQFKRINYHTETRHTGSNPQLYELGSWHNVLSVSDTDLMFVAETELGEVVRTSLINLAEYVAPFGEQLSEDIAKIS